MSRSDESALDTEQKLAMLEEVTEILWEAIWHYAYEEDGVIARRALRKLKAKFPWVSIPTCEHCGDTFRLHVLRGGREVCKDAQRCFNEEELPDFVDGYGWSCSRDHNAALNILAAGASAAGLGDVRRDHVRAVSA